jgi:hypothetical protein
MTIFWIIVGLILFQLIVGTIATVMFRWFGTYGSTPKWVDLIWDKLYNTFKFKKD